MKGRNISAAVKLKLARVREYLPMEISYLSACPGKGMDYNTFPHLLLYPRLVQCVAHLTCHGLCMNKSGEKIKGRDFNRTQDKWTKCMLLYLSQLESGHKMCWSQCQSHFVFAVEIHADRLSPVLLTSFRNQIDVTNLQMRLLALYHAPCMFFTNLDVCHIQFV